MEVSMTVSDEHLMSLVSRTGDRRAFSALMQRYKKTAYLFALKLVKNHDDAMDISQDAFVKLLCKASHYQVGRSFRAYFFRIVRNTALNYRRLAFFRTRAGGDELIAHLVDETADSASRARQEELWRAIMDLPLPLREVLVLRHQHGMDYREIAQVLSISINTVATRIHHARKELRRSHVL